MAIDLTKKLTQFWSDIRKDSEALFEARQLVFGVVIVLAVTYGLYVFQVEGRDNEKRKKLSYKNELVASLGGQELARLTALQVEKVSGQKKVLQDNIELLQFKQSIMREQYASSENSDSFANIIFTLLPISPVNLEKGFVQMNVLDSRQHEFYQIHPISFQGKIQYSDFLYYLKYLEKRQEVGMIGKVTVELVDATFFGGKNEVQFDVELGRIQLLDP